MRYTHTHTHSPTECIIHPSYVVRSIPINDIALLTFDVDLFEDGDEIIQSAEMNEDAG